MKRAGAAQATRKKMRRPEQALQIALVELLAYVLTPSTYFFHVPNGGYRSRAEAGILKAMGVRAGVMDLIFIDRGLAFGMELKAPGEQPDDDQRGAAIDIQRAGAGYGFATTIDEALALLRAWEIPLRIAEARAA